MCNVDKPIACVWALLGVLAVAAPAGAVDGVVGPGNCNEAGFDSVLNTVDGSGGGTITFNCGAATIPFTSYKQIAGAVTIDGNNLIVFDGGGNSAFFQIFAGANVILRRLTLRDGMFASAHPLENIGTLTLDTIELTGNIGLPSSAIANFGTLAITSSTISGNEIFGDVASTGAALSNDGGDVVIEQSVFDGNSVNAAFSGNGGAIANLSGALTVLDSTFTSNNALDGGAIYIDPNSGSVRIDGSVFSTNSAGYGAALETWGADVQVLRSTFDDNAAQADGGAIWSAGGQLVVNSSQFTGNTAGTTGGAISCYGDIANVVNSAFGSNQAGTNGGGIYSTCTFSALNVTFNANTAPAGGGGAIYQSGSIDAVVTFATIDGNTAMFGGGLFNDDGSGGIMHIGNSIVSANPGGNCDGLLTSNGYNLSNDAGCGGAFNGPGDVLNASLPLETFGDYGGPTSTQPPLEGNPAIDHVPVASCGFPTDQRGAGRPAGAGCDSGAVELAGVIDHIFGDGFDHIRFP